MNAPNAQNSATALAQAERPAQIAAAMKGDISKILPKHIDAEAFTRTVQTALVTQPDLMQADKTSLFTACLKAATDGLILDGREAALVIRNVKTKVDGKDAWQKAAVYQPMVQGLMKLARNSGKIASLTAQVVYENDQFMYVLGDSERIEHAPAPFDKDRGKPIGVYAIAKLTDGTIVREVMRSDEVMNIARQGQNAFQYTPPYEDTDDRGQKVIKGGKNFAEWWRKTAIRRIAKYIPRSSDQVGQMFDTAAERIDEDFDWDQQGEQSQPVAQPAKKRGAAAEALKNITPKQDETPHDLETGEIIDADPGPQPGDDI
jgi:recombination protein RecT